jgi:hypothetical protein
MTLATLVARNANEAIVAPMVGSDAVCIWLEYGFRRYIVVYQQLFNKFCTFSAICKYSAAINCITVQHRKVLFPSTLTGHAVRW